MAWVNLLRAARGWQETGAVSGRGEEHVGSASGQVEKGLGVVLSSASSSVCGIRYDDSQGRPLIWDRDLRAAHGEDPDRPVRIG